MKLSIETPLRRLPGMFEAFSIFTLASAAVLIPLALATDVPVGTSPLRFLGLACPLCGGTRAVTAFCLGRLETAILYNPLALVIFVSMVYSSLSYLFFVLPTGRRLVLMTTRGEARALTALLATCFAANWGYVLWAGMYRVPLTM
jgi:hypothetical protein